MFRLSKKALNQGLTCRVKLLTGDDELEISYTNSSIGQDILDQVVSKLDLRDKDYYSLKIHNQLQWLDLTKSVVKQTKGLDIVLLELRFKYYPAEPALLANESTRYYLYLQLRLDLIEGRLRSDDQDTLAFLIACTLQSELGDSEYNTNSQNSNYVSEFKFVPNQTEELEWAAIKLHQGEDFLGLQPADAELNFLKKASQLDTYGIDPYPVKEGNSHNHFLIGVNHLGISTFQDSKKTNQFSWNEIVRISLDNKLVLIYCKKTEKKGVKTRPLFGFRCPSQDHAYNFWKIATEHRYFFTLLFTPAKPIVTNTGGLFKKSHKLTYAGRVEKDVLRDYVDEYNHKSVKRSHSLMSKSMDGPRWQGFHNDNNSSQASMNNLYSSDALNKTMPTDLGCFREEEEDQIQDFPNRKPSINSSAPRKRLSAASVATQKDQSSDQFTGRRSNLTTKKEHIPESAPKDKFYACSSQQDHDFIKITIFLLLIIFVTFVIILSTKESDRPESVNLLVKRLRLEYASRVMREGYYLPIRSAIDNVSNQLLSMFL